MSIFRPVNQSMAPLSPDYTITHRWPQGDDSQILQSHTSTRTATPVDDNSLTKGCFNARTWSQREDARLTEIVEDMRENGKISWVVVSQYLGCRSAKQCRERWEENLRPDLKKYALTPEECEKISELVKAAGRKWALIAKKLEGRSGNTVKNWWYSVENRRIRLEDKMRRNKRKMAISSLTT